MPRRHRKLDFSLSGPSSAPEEALWAPPARDAQLGQAAEVLREAARLLSVHALGPRRRVALRHRWNQDTPAQALRLAALLAAEPSLFAPLPFDAAVLCAGEERLRRIAALKELCEELSDHAADLLLAEKAALHDQVRLGTTAVTSLLAGPLTDAEVLLRLRPQAEPLLRPLAERRAAIRRKKRRHAQLPAPGPKALLPA